MDMRVGIYADFKKTSKEEREAVKECGFTDIILGMNRETDKSFFLNPNGWSRNKKKAQQLVIDECNSYMDMGVIPHILGWLQPTVKYNKQFRDTIDPILDRSDYIESIVFDCEYHYRRGTKSVRGMQKHRDAVELFWPIWEDIEDDYQFIVSSFGALPGEVIPLLGKCDGGTGQAYSTFMTGKNGRLKWTQKERYAPGNFQNLAIKSWNRKLRPDQDHIVSLANYAQRRRKTSYAPMMKAKTSLTLALQEVQSRGIRTVWYWSLKHIKSNSARAQMTRSFIKNIPKMTYLK